MEELGRRYEFENMLVNLRKSLLRELDFTIEANNLHTIGENLAEFESIVVPEPVDDYSTTRVLTMEYISGKKAGISDDLLPAGGCRRYRAGIQHSILRRETS